MVSLFGFAFAPALILAPLASPALFIGACVDLVIK